MREATVLESLNHPNIPKYYDFFSENNYHSIENFKQNLQQLKGNYY